MEYIEIFKNLRTNNKYGRKSPHKAVLMLTVIELFERNALSENIITYNDLLKSTFVKVWNKVLPNESRFHPIAYLPFWYLQNDSFWHIIPKSGKEEVLSLMRDVNQKPSESIIYSSVECAMLDEDLYFILTIPSGRLLLRKVLLENYTDLTVDEINDFSNRILKDNYNNPSSENIDETTRDDILRSNKREVNYVVVNQFNELSKGLQIVVNFQYYSFLMNYRNYRQQFEEYFPNVYELYDKIINHSIKKNDIESNFSFMYENFLSDLKVALISEEGGYDFIDAINLALGYLHGEIVDEEEKETEVEKENCLIVPDEPVEEQIEVDDEDFGDDKINNDLDIEKENFEIEQVYLDHKGNVIRIEKGSSKKSNDIQESDSRRGKPWTTGEEERMKSLFQRGVNFSTIADTLKRTEVAIKLRLAKLGLIDYQYSKEENNVSPSNDLQLVDFAYSSIAVTGKVKKYEDDLKAMGGVLRVSIRYGSIWLFSEKCRSKLERYIKGDRSVVHDTKDVNKM